MTSTAEPRSQAAPLVCAGSFALSTLLALGLARDDARWAVCAAGCALAALGVGLLARRRVGPALALALLNLLLLVPELGLRSAGFRYVAGIRFGYPDPTQFSAFELDEQLFWTLPKSGDPQVNSLGFYGPEPATPKPAGTLRLLVLGDSCAQQGYPRAWPELAAEALGAVGVRLEVVNLAMSGYSSHQGRVLAEREGARLEPDLVAVAYGWNDHWLARGSIDAEKRVDLRGQRVYGASRVLQALRKLLDSGQAAGEARVLELPRVPLEEYRENLRRIVAVFRERGARVVLITAPSLHDLLVPSYLTLHAFARSPQDVVDLHRRYNDVVREVQREGGAELLDLERELAARPDRTQLFDDDGIHFDEAGRALVAERFAALVHALVAPR